MTPQYSIFLYILMYSFGDLHAQLARTPHSCKHFKIMIMAINVDQILVTEPDSRTSSFRKSQYMRKPVFRDLRSGYGEYWISQGIYYTDFLTAKNRVGCTC